MATGSRPISSLRWWIGGLLFASTVINYIDRQTLSLLAPYLKLEYHWTNSDYANLAIAFRVAYSIGQSAFGRLMDRVGTRRGLTMTVICYSIVSMLTSLARGFYSFVTFRFLLGAGESANWPAATKAVSEWFPKRERALATALFDGGSSIGGAVAPFLVLWSLFSLGMASGVCGAGGAGVSVADCVAGAVSHSRNASADQHGGARDDCRGQAASGADSGCAASSCVD